MPSTFAPAPDFFAQPSTLLDKLQLRPQQPRGHDHVAGLVEMTELQPGLILQRMRVCDLEDRESQGTVLPGVKIGLVVGGRSDLRLGHQAFRLGPQTAGAACGMLVSVAEPDGYRRYAHRGQQEHKLVLTLLPEWWGAQGGDDAQARQRIQAFATRHLARLDWQPSPRVVSLAHQVVHAPAQQGLVERLHREARVIEIVAEALGAVSGAPAAEPLPGSRVHRRLCELLARLDTGEFDGCSLIEIAKQVGMSASSLQRHFKAFRGQSLFEHLRGRRLDIAREALMRQGLPVARAAELAGYGSAANFATAFRRRFGCAPSAARAAG